MKNNSFSALLVRWAVLALGVTIAAKVISGIYYDTLGTLLVVVLLLSFFNAVLRPLLLLFSLPFIVLTMGLGVLIINALLFLLVGEIVNGFEVSSFLAALGGALIVSITNLIVSTVIGKKPDAARGGPGAPKRERKAKPDDVIDI